MTTAKTLFLKPDPKGGESLALWWTRISHDDRFLEVLTYARADMMEGKPKQEEMVGAENLAQTLLTLSDNPDLGTEIPTPGIVHRIEPKKP